MPSQRSDLQIVVAPVRRPIVTIGNAGGRGGQLRETGAGAAAIGKSSASLAPAPTDPRHDDDRRIDRSPLASHTPVTRPPDVCTATTVGHPLDARPRDARIAANTRLTFAYHPSFRSRQRRCRRGARP
jgi:hypothetical protein